MMALIHFEETNYESNFDLDQNFKTKIPSRTVKVTLTHLQCLRKRHFNSASRLSFRVPFMDQSGLLEDTEGGSK